MFPPFNLKWFTKRQWNWTDCPWLQQLFQPIPIFTNSTKFSLTELVSSIYVETIGFDITEQEFKLLLSQKLSHRVKTMMKDHQLYSIESIYSIYYSIKTGTSFSLIIKTTLWHDCLHLRIHYAFLPSPLKSKPAGSIIYTEVIGVNFTSMHIYKNKWLLWSAGSKFGIFPVEISVRNWYMYNKIK